MFSLVKQLKEQTEKLTTLKAKYEAVKEINALYCGWTFAYRQTVIELYQRGEITAEQRDLFYKRATEYYNIWLTK